MAASSGKALYRRPDVHGRNRISCARPFGAEPNRKWWSETGRAQLSRLLVLWGRIRETRRQTKLSGSLDWCSSRLPPAPSAGHCCDVRVAHLLDCISCEYGSEPPNAVQDDFRVLIGNSGLDVPLNHALPEV